MAKGTVHLCAGIYDRLETAEGDFSALKTLHNEGLVGDFALCERLEQVLPGLSQPWTVRA